MSGGAGFCPSPHLHLQLQEGEGDTAPTVYFAFLDHEDNPYFPVAGKWYGAQGEAVAPSKAQQEDVLEGRTLEKAGVSGEGPDARKRSGGVREREEGCEVASRGTYTLPSASR